MPKISVAMPLYNAEKHVEKTLKSILNQTYKDYEIIIIDDASTDNSIQIVERMNDNRIKIYKNSKNSGIAFTRNRAIQLSNGEYIALMDNDDIAPNERLQKEVDFLDKNSDIDVVGGHCRFIDENGTVIKNKQWNVCLDPNYIKAYLMLGNTVANSSVLFRKKFVVENNINFKDNMYGVEDYLFWVECSFYGKIANLDEVLLHWRAGHGNETEKVMKHHENKRREKIDYIHTYALQKNGFVLTVDELKLVNKVFMEEGIIDNKQEMKQLYLAMRTIAIQAVELKLDNSKEIVTMCRKRFGEKVGKAFYLWK